MLKPPTSVCIFPFKLTPKRLEKNATNRQPHVNKVAYSMRVLNRTHPYLDHKYHKFRRGGQYILHRTCTPCIKGLSENRVPQNHWFNIICILTCPFAGISRFQMNPKFETSLSWIVISPLYLSIFDGSLSPRI